MEEPSPTVHIVDDDQAVRSALEWILRSAGFKSVSYPSAEAFLRLCPRTASVGCILLDIRMEGMGGLELQEKLRRDGVLLPVIIISGHADVPTAVQALEAGAVDLIEKPLDRQVVLQRVQETLRHQAQSSTQIAEVQEARAHYATLTQREREVMGLMLAGNLSKQIATALGLSERTVEKHRARVMEKMHAQTAADLGRRGHLVQGLGSET